MKDWDAKKKALDEEWISLSHYASDRKEQLDG
jgi:hypothetical protein